MLNALTIDLEEYFHPTEVQPFVNSGAWETLPSRVEQQTRELLDLLHNKNTKATFFVLGWVAERHPQLLRAIAGAGHEIGCHSYAHQLVYQLTPAAFRSDTERAVKTIADAVGVVPRIYRAPSYSITSKSLWALDILVECGFTHDSSIYPISHDRYGIPGSARHPYVIQTAPGPLTEVPIATAKLSNGAVIPIGGGGYLRLLPYRYTAAGIRLVNSAEQRPVCIYLHPWEIDPAQPRIAHGMIARARTYCGLKAMRGKLNRLLTDFRFSTMTDVYGQTTYPLRVAAGGRA
jgi:polysaccharide deacetylase family protein (PEP-CTERM system associated)